ncbi:MAG: AI-2E family transporter [Methanosarcinales archaeon]|nr:AI-2E family transporter [Methanosarcinales archaeon]
MINSLARKRFILLVLIIVIAASLLVIYLSWPFLNVIILSLFSAYVLRPLDRTLRKITKIQSQRISAILTIVVVAAIFSAVFLNIIFILGYELARFQPIVMEYDVNAVINSAMELLDNYIPDSIQENMRNSLSSSVSNAIAFIITNLQQFVVNFISDLAIITLQLVVVIFMVYYLLIDGDNILHTFIEILPSNRVNIVKDFLDHLDSIYNSLFNVYLIVCILTGIIGAIGLTLLRVPYPAMWGAIIAILALLPIVGPGTFYIPASIFYFLTNQPVKAVILLIFGWLFLETIPGNIIRPRLMMQRGHIHPIITLLAFTAPLFVVGAIGIIVGPAAYGFMLAVYRTYMGFEVENKQENKEENESDDID